MINDAAAQALHIEALETALLDPVRRKEENFLASVLADDFREYGSSGKIYSKSAIIENLRVERPSQFEIQDFAASAIGEQVVLATYRIQRTGADVSIHCSLRSSVWVWRSDRWQMIFHQGTKLVLSKAAARRLAGT